MRRYALKEDGHEKGAAKQRFESRHLNQGGAAGYIAKYIAKNIDGYALDGQLDHDTGKPLKDTAAAVTAWASTWRIPQFKPIGLPTMGAYRELRKLPRGVSIASEFDDRVEAARAAADKGDFDLYIIAQGGANMPRDAQAVRVARKVTDEVNEYDTSGGDPVMTPTPSEQAAAVLNLIESGVIDWNEPDVVKVLNGALKACAQRKNRQQRSNAPLKANEQAPSARMTKPERDRAAKIRFDLAQKGITPERWEIDVLARGATVVYNGKKFRYPVADEWQGFPMQEE